MNRDALQVLRTTEQLLTRAAAAPLLPQPWGIVLAAAGSAAGLAADLMGEGLDPVGAIEELRSAVPHFRAARGRLADLISERARTAEARRRESGE